MFIYPDYKHHEKYFDIALIKLKHSAPFTYNIWPACLVIKSDFKLGVNFTVTGFGRNDIRNSKQFKRKS